MAVAAAGVAGNRLLPSRLASSGELSNCLVVIQNFKTCSHDNSYEWDYTE